MKALTLTQPWATLVALQAKRLETRSWRTSYRGPLAIHAAKSIPKSTSLLCCQEPFRTALQAGGYKPENSTTNNPFGLPLGAVIAVAILTDIQSITLENQPPELEHSFGDYTPGRFAWILQNIYPLPNPIPINGTLGLWEWHPSEPTILPVSLRLF